MRNLAIMSEQKSVSELLKELSEREKEARDRLQEAHKAVDRDIGKPLPLINMTRGVLAEIAALPFISRPEVIDECPSKWLITLPPLYVEGRMTYSQKQFEVFRKSIELGNNTMDSLIEMYGEGAKKYLISRALKGDFYNFANWASMNDDAGGHPVRVSWKTFALPNLLNKPLLGKDIKFMHAIDSKQGHLQGMNYWFNVADTKEEGIRPFFYCRRHYAGSDCETFNQMRDHIKKLNPDGFGTEVYDRR